MGCGHASESAQDATEQQERAPHPTQAAQPDFQEEESELFSNIMKVKYKFPHSILLSYSPEVDNVPFWDIFVYKKKKKADIWVEKTRRQIYQ